MITVAQLVAHLLTLPQDLPVAHSLYSDYVETELSDINIFSACVGRHDGIVQSARPDKPAIDYLILS